MVSDPTPSAGAGVHTRGLIPEATDRHVGPSAGAGDQVAPPCSPSPPARPASPGHGPWPPSPCQLCPLVLAFPLFSCRGPGLVCEASVLTLTTRVVEASATGCPLLVCTFVLKLHSLS